MSEIMPDYMQKYVKEVTEKLLDNYADIIKEMSKHKLSIENICDLNISIAASFLLHILQFLETKYKDNLGEEIYMKNSFAKIVNDVEDLLKLHEGK